LGPNHASRPREALALARTYARAGLDARAKAAYERVIELSGLPSGFGPRLDALRALARTSRRSRRFDEAADYWQQILDIGACPEDRASEASEALAIHHEHRIRDLATAQAFALRSLKKDAHPTWNEAVHHRLARIQRKMKDLQFETSSLNFAEASDAGFEA
jgi:tetratricopeptide (TPR) repeat protein